MLGLKLNHVSKRGPRCQFYQYCMWHKHLSITAPADVLTPNCARSSAAQWFLQQVRHVFFKASWASSDYTGNIRDHSVYVPNQSEMPLHCNAIFHWLGAYTEWSLNIILISGRCSLAYKVLYKGWHFSIRSVVDYIFLQSVNWSGRQTNENKSYPI